MASTPSSASNGESDVNVYNLLAVQDDEASRLNLLKRHDTLKAKMDELKKVRADQNKVKKQMSASLKLVQRQKKRIVNNATSLSTNDIVQILCLKNEQQHKKQAKAKAGPRRQEE